MTDSGEPNGEPMARKCQGLIRMIHGAILTALDAAERWEDNQQKGRGHVIAQILGALRNTSHLRSQYWLPDDAPNDTIVLH